jgi:ankyrin repeat protein
MAVEEWMRAVAMNDQAMVKKLLAAGQAVDEVGPNGGTALADAAQRGNVELVKLLLDGSADPNRDLGDNDTPLMRAAEGGHRKILELLLAAGADPLRKNGPRTALGRAAMGRTAGHAASLERLLGLGADPAYGPFTTVLMTAAEYASPAMVEALLRAGAPVNASTKNGSALSRAVLAGRADVVSVLVAAGADPDFRFPPEPAASYEIAGRTPRELAAKKKKILAALQQAPAR